MAEPESTMIQVGWPWASRTLKYPTVQSGTHVSEGVSPEETDATALSLQAVAPVISGSDVQAASHARADPRANRGLDMVLCMRGLTGGA